jgi:hypothetical protein
MRIFSPLGGASVDIDRIPSHSTIFAAIKFIKFLDILFAQLKVKHPDVGTYAIRILRLRKKNKTGHAIRYIVAGERRVLLMLHRPTNEDLCWILAILRGNVI